MKYLILHRKEYTKDSTLGELYIGNKFFGYTLEDTARPFGVKVNHHTCIPQNLIEGYKVGIRYSPSFNRDMLILYTENDKETLSLEGISFKYIYFHGGNTAGDTDGCVLVARHKYENSIQGSLEGELFDIVSQWVKEGIEVRCIVKNYPQAG